MPYSNWKPQRFIDVDSQIVSDLINHISYNDTHYRTIKAYTELHAEYSRLFDAYFDAQQEIHTLLIENKALRGSRDDH